MSIGILGEYGKILVGHKYFPHILRSTFRVFSEYAKNFSRFLSENLERMKNVKKIFNFKIENFYYREKGLLFEKTENTLKLIMAQHEKMADPLFMI
jgi:hypothetical protein